MNCTIPVANLKIMVKAVQTLSKIGDELYIEARKDSLLLRSINLNKTVFCSFEFFNSFFTGYSIADFETESEDTPELVCKIQMKAILAIFKPLQRDKNLDFFQIELEQNSDTITFKLRYKFDVIVIHKVHLLDMESWKVSYSKDNSMNQITARGQCFSQVLLNFQLQDDDLSLEVMLHKIIMRNYELGEINSVKGIRSQYVLNAIEFAHFKISQPTNITFALRPFRSAVHFAEHFNMNLTLHFETAGKPVVAIVKDVTFELNIVMATVGPDGSTQNSLGTFAPSLLKRKTNVSYTANANLTVQDREALENIDWDDNLDDLQQNKDHRESWKKGKQKPTLGSLFSEATEDVLSNERVASEVNNGNVPAEVEEIDCVSASPESPKSKRIKLVFGRCYEPTFREDDSFLGKVLAPNSDEELD